MLRAVATVALFALAGCAGPGDPMVDAPESLSVTSSAFSDGDPIPRQYTCQGDDTAPDLAVVGLPEGARYVSLVFDDPDSPSGTWTHWTFWDLPVDALPLPADADVAVLGAVEGENTWGRTGYGGPCPGSGTHRYFFRVFATEEPLGPPGGAKVGAVWSALEEKALAQGRLMGTYVKT